ncbi:hypothetical protein GRJ2_000105600 [Grus japonensis]|uniref:Uncharacterized protein n=1 Tax=Grus japonensis TaxID=30415 RepID=A0ABC9VSG9_GRUJA
MLPLKEGTSDRGVFDFNAWLWPLTTNGRAAVICDAEDRSRQHATLQSCAIATQHHRKEPDIHPAAAEDPTRQLLLCRLLLLRSDTWAQKEMSRRCGTESCQPLPSPGHTCKLKGWSSLTPGTDKYK